MELVLVTTLATARQDTRDQDVKKQVRTSGYVNHLYTLGMYSVLTITANTLQQGNVSVLTVIVPCMISTLDSTHG